MTVQSRHKQQTSLLATTPSASHRIPTINTAITNNVDHSSTASGSSSSPSKAMKHSATSCFTMAIMIKRQVFHPKCATIVVCVSVAGIIYITLFSRISLFMPQFQQSQQMNEQQQQHSLAIISNQNNQSQQSLIQEQTNKNPMRKPLHKSDVLAQHKQKQRRVVILQNLIDMEEHSTAKRRNASFPTDRLIDKGDAVMDGENVQQRRQNATYADEQEVSTISFYPYEKPYHEECTPMADWQTQFYPTCNTIHELSVLTDENAGRNEKNDNYQDHTSSGSTATHVLSMMGFWRMVWKVPLFQEQHNVKSSKKDEIQQQKQPQHAVLKMLHLHRDFNTESYHLNQVDSIAMERLSFSPYVIDEYAFCGQSVLTEFGIGEARATLKDNKAKSDDRLRFARDLALGLNDIHSLNYRKGRNATFAHNDVNIANMVLAQNNKLKYNDFNIGIMMKWNATHDKPCGFPVKFGGTPLWRSPEEIKNVTYVSEKVDIYALGNVLFQVLTKHQPWTWLEPNGRPTYEEVLKRKVKGDIPHLPSKYKDAKSGASVALQAAIYSCFNPDPLERPTAYKLANGFEQILIWRKEKASVNMTDIVALFA